MKRAFLLAGLTVAVLPLLGFYAFSTSFIGGLMGSAPPLETKQPVYMAIIREIEGGRMPIGTRKRSKYPHNIAPDNSVDLPPRYESVAPKVYAERRSDGHLLVLFATWLGRGADLNGYLYSSRPLTPDDFFTSDWGAGGVHEQMHACGISYIKPVHIRGPWYYVCRRLD